MKDRVFKNFAEVLVHDFYKNNPDYKFGGFSLITKVLHQIKEAGENHLKYEATEDKDRVAFTNKESVVAFSLTFKHDELPTGENKEELTNFIEKILKEVVYKYA